MFYELNLVREKKMFCVNNSCIKNNKNLVIKNKMFCVNNSSRKNVRNMFRLGVYDKRYDNTCWYKNLESLYILLYKPSLNTRKIV